MLRLFKTALLVLVPLVTIGALATGCEDDTTSAPVDMAMAPVTDMAKANHD